MIQKKKKMRPMGASKDGRLFSHSMASRIRIGCFVVPGFHPGLWTGTLSGCTEENEVTANKQMQNIVATAPNFDLMRCAGEIKK
jgi:hypothetical protein